MEIIFPCYDADGAKLKRKFISATGGGTKVTWYMGIYQYEEVTGGSNPQPFALSFISFSEGRIRPITAVNTSNGYDALAKDALLTLPGSKKGSIDYFITDHRSDVRMILTEETQWSYTTASMETLNGRNATEEAIFGLELTASRVAKSTVPAWASNTSQQVTRLSSSTQKIGPNQLLKVMAGDLISTNVQYYFNTISYSDGGSTLGPNVINTLAGILTSSATISSAIKTGVPGISANLGATGGFGYWLHYNASNAASALPKAQLSVLFFDERFNFVSESSQLARVTTMYDGAAPLALLNIKVPKNGYCLVYISNESSIPVYFDSMQVRHDRGRIIEENHYYAYGLKIAALSSKAFGGAPNNYQYQSDYSEFDDDLGWNDFMLRSYDPQIGRFLQHDPYDQFASGYVGMGNDPGNMVDEDGGWSAGAIGAVAGGVIGGVAGGIIANKNGGGFWGTLGGALGGAFVGAGLGFAGGESLFGNECFNFWTNIKAFYSGLFGGTGNVTGGSMFNGHSALVPDVWGTIGGLSLNLNLSISLNLGSFASWVSGASSTVKVVETLYKVIEMGSFQRDGYQEWPNYAGEFDLDPLPEGSSYRIEPPRESDANFNAYDGMPSKGPIGPGRHRVDARVRTNELVREQINHAREIKQAQDAGMNVQPYIENRRRNIRNTIDRNNKSKIKIYQIDKVKREKSFRYLKIFWGIPLKFIRKTG